MKWLSTLFSLETFGLEVDREYKNLNKWYEKSDTFNTWLYFNEKVIDEENYETATKIPAVKEKLAKSQVFLCWFSKTLSKRETVQGDVKRIQF